MALCPNELSCVRDRPDLRGALCVVLRHNIRFVACVSFEVLWRIPWHYAQYEVDCTYNQSSKIYKQFKFTHQSKWASAEIELEDTGATMSLAPGFSTIQEQVLILTHPVDGYFYRLDKKVGTYSVWHEEIPLTVGKAKHLYFSLYERLGLLSRDEMQKPHSVFICPKVQFDVHLPPKRAE